jgi:hypothetical protein
VPNYPYENILLHTQFDQSGWIIYGIQPNSGGKIPLVTIAHIVGRSEAEKWANELAKRLAGKYLAEED